MQAYLTLTRRELASFFVSFTGYVVIAAAVFLTGASFVSLLFLLQGRATPAPVTELFFSTQYFWDIVLLSGPIITMRLFSLEKFSGTFEALMTTPVSDLQVVLAKFSAGMIIYLALWLPSLVIIFVLRHYMSHPEALDGGLLGSTYLGIFLLGGLFISLGCFASSLTRSQIVAAMISLALSYGLFEFSYLSGNMPVTAGWKSEAVSYLALSDNMNDFARGLVDTRHVVFFVSVTILFLFLTLRVVESRRWK